MTEHAAHPIAVFSGPDSSELVDLIRSIGGGFHPDTRGADYLTLPDGITAEDVDRIIDDAFARGVEVYDIALDLIHEVVG